MRRILPGVVSIVCAVAMVGCSGERPRSPNQEDVPMKKVMVSPLAGRWFQDSERALRDEIAELCKGITVVRKKMCARRWCRMRVTAFQDVWRQEFFCALTPNRSTVLW